NGLTLQDFDFYEIHGAFAPQTLATPKAWESEESCRERSGLDHPRGAIDRPTLHVKGSALAAGHPFAATVAASSPLPPRRPRRTAAAAHWSPSVQQVARASSPSSSAKPAAPIAKEKAPRGGGSSSPAGRLWRAQTVNANRCFYWNTRPRSV